MELKGIHIILLFSWMHGVSGLIRVCYFTNWAQHRPGVGRFTPENIDPFLCSHIVFAYAWLSGNHLTETQDNDEPNIGDAGLYSKVTQLKDINPELKILLAVGGWNAGSPPFSNMVSANYTRQEFIQSTISYLRNRDFDGIDIDWEYPTRRRGRPTDKRNLNHLLIEMRHQFRVESTQTGRDMLMITAVVPPGSLFKETGYDVSVISSVLEFIHVRTYDFHGSWGSRVEHPSALFPRTGEIGDDALLNMASSILYWMSLGVPKKKLVASIALYGRSYTLMDATNHTLGAPDNGRGPAAPYTEEAGFIAYYEICDLIRNGAQRYWSDEHKVPYLVNGTTWIGYDDPDSITLKMRWMKDMNIGGVMIWALDLDDFSGNFCNQGISPLLTTVNLKLVDRKFNIDTNPVGISSKHVNVSVTKLVDDIGRNQKYFRNDVRVPSDPGTHVPENVKQLAETVMTVRSDLEINRTAHRDNYRELQKSASALHYLLARLFGETITKEPEQRLNSTNFTNAGNQDNNISNIKYIVHERNSSSVRQQPTPIVNDISNQILRQNQQKAALRLNESAVISEPLTGLTNSLNLFSLDNRLYSSLVTSTSKPASHYASEEIGNQTFAVNQIPVHFDINNGSETNTNIASKDAATTPISISNNGLVPDFINKTVDDSIVINTVDKDEWKPTALDNAYRGNVHKNTTLPELKPTNSQSLSLNRKLDHLVPLDHLEFSRNNASVLIDNPTLSVSINQTRHYSNSGSESRSNTASVDASTSNIFLPRHDVVFDVINTILDDSNTLSTDDIGIDKDVREPTAEVNAYRQGAFKNPTSTGLKPSDTQSLSLDSKFESSVPVYDPELSRGNVSVLVDNKRLVANNNQTQRDSHNESDSSNNTASVDASIPNFSIPPENGFISSIINASEVNAVTTFMDAVTTNTLIPNNGFISTVISKSFIDSSDVGTILNQTIHDKISVGIDNTIIDVGQSTAIDNANQHNAYISSALNVPSPSNTQPFALNSILDSSEPLAHLDFFRGNASVFIANQRLQANNKPTPHESYTDSERSISASMNASKPNIPITENDFVFDVINTNVDERIDPWTTYNQAIYDEIAADIANEITYAGKSTTPINSELQTAYDMLAFTGPTSADRNSFNAIVSDSQPLTANGEFTQHAGFTGSVSSRQTIPVNTAKANTFISLGTLPHMENNHSVVSNNITVVDSRSTPDTAYNHTNLRNVSGLDDGAHLYANNTAPGTDNRHSAFKRFVVNELNIVEKSHNKPLINADINIPQSIETTPSVIFHDGMKLKSKSVVNASEIVKVSPQTAKLRLFERVESGVLTSVLSETIIYDKNRMDLSNILQQKIPNYQKLDFKNKTKNFEHVTKSSANSIRSENGNDAKKVNIDTSFPLFMPRVHMFDTPLERPLLDKVSMAEIIEPGVQKNRLDNVNIYNDDQMNKTDDGSQTNYILPEYHSGMKLKSRSIEDSVRVIRIGPKKAKIRLQGRVKAAVFSPTISQWDMTNKLQHEAYDLNSLGIRP